MMPEKISPVRERRRWKEETIHDIRTLLPIVRKFVVHTTVDGHDEDICFILPPLPITHATVDQCGHACDLRWGGGVVSNTAVQAIIEIVRDYPRGPAGSYTWEMRGGFDIAHCPGGCSHFTGALCVASLSTYTALMLDTLAVAYCRDRRQLHIRRQLELSDRVRPLPASVDIQLT